MDTLRTALMVLGGILMAVGVFISARGYWRSMRSEQMDSRSYFKGVALILLGVGLQVLSEQF